MQQKDGGLWKEQVVPLKGKGLEVLVATSLPACCAA